MALVLDQFGEQVEALYIAYFGRAGEPDGFNYWLGQLQSGKMTFAQVAASFSQQPEAKAQHPFLANPNLSAGAFVDNLYQQLLNRVPDAEGRAYWLAQLGAANGNDIKIGILIAQFISGANATNGDAAIIQNKIDAGLYFTTEFQAAGIGGTTNGATLDPKYLAIARDAVDNEISSNPASIAETRAEVDAFLKSSPTPSTPTPSTPTTPPPPLNDAPNAADKIIAGNEDTTIAISLSATDNDGSIIAFQITTLPLNGVLSLNADGSGALQAGAVIPVTANNLTVYFKPNLNYNGPATFQYTAVDSDSAVDATPANVTINVVPVNDQPTGPATGTLDDGLEDTRYDVSAVQLLANYVDSDGDILALANVSYTEDGGTSVPLTPVAGIYSFTPSANFNGNITITYDVIDGQGGTLPGVTRTLTIVAINDAPVASNDIYDVDEDGSITLDVTDNDTDIENATLVPIIVTQATHGTVTSNPDGTLQYTPNPNYNGLDSFTYQASDGTDRSNVATVNINVLPVNDLPVALPANGQGPEDTTIAILLSASDPEDPDGSVSSFVIQSISAVGTIYADENRTQALGVDDIVPAMNGSVTLYFRPNENYNGNAEFYFAAIDNEGGTSNSTRALVSIDPVNDAPMGSPAAVLSPTDEDQSFTITQSQLLQGFTDVDNTLLATNVRVSNATIAPAGADFTVTPTQNFSGFVEIRYDVTDGTNVLSNNVLQQTVRPVNDAPIFTQTIGATASTPILVPENTSTSFLTITASDVENNPVTFSLASSASSNDNSLFRIDSSGNLRFANAPNFEARAPDQNNDGIYRVEVIAHDGIDSTVEDYFVRVTDVLENVVLNGNFNNGSNWSVNGGNTQISGGTAYFGAINNTGRMSQTVATIAGETYTFEFDLSAGSGGPNSFQAYLDNARVLNFSNAGGLSWTHYSFSYTADDSSTTISFVGQHNPSYFYLDNVMLST